MGLLRPLETKTCVDETYREQSCTIGPEFILSQGLKQHPGWKVLLLPFRHIFYSQLIWT